MLVLTRKINESIVISNDIVITILSIDRDKVKIGIKARKEIPIIRKELIKAFEEQNIIASKIAGKVSGEEFEELRKVLVQQMPGEDESEEVEKNPSATEEKNSD